MPTSLESDAESLHVLCEDGPVIAVNKPAGIVVQGAPPGVDNLADLVRQYLRVKYDKPGNVYLGVPHRLDRPVTGVVIFSRNSKCAARLAEQFAQRKVEKVYRAILEQPPATPAGSLIDWLVRVGGVDESDAPDAEHYTRPKVVVGREGEPDAKRAVLHYRTLSVVRGRALVEINLETGRMHQIRVQFASRGCPIVGDTQYGARTALDGDRIRPATAQDETRYHPIALHAARLKLLHPVRYDELTITAPLPAAWKALGFDMNDSAT